MVVTEALEMYALMERQKFRFRGERVRELREALGWTETKLAAEAGVTANAIRKWESGETKNPGVAYVKPLADALGVHMEDLLEPLDG